MRRLLVIALTSVVIACTTTKNDIATSNDGVAMSVGKYPNKKASHIPKARIYKTIGDYRDKVPVDVNPGSGQIISFPATTDINPANQPIELIDGYLLDHRGISATSVFTTYSYAEYAGLSETPSVETLKASIIPGAIVTEIHELPITATEALADTARCNEIIRAGFPDCKSIKQ